jgi:hypothetical protein
MRTSAGPHATAVYAMWVQVVEAEAGSNQRVVYDYDYAALPFVLEAEGYGREDWAEVKRWLDVLMHYMNVETAPDAEIAPDDPWEEPEWKAWLSEQDWLGEDGEGDGESAEC